MLLDSTNGGRVDVGYYGGSVDVGYWHFSFPTESAADWLDLGLEPVI